MHVATEVWEHAPQVNLHFVALRLLSLCVQVRRRLILSGQANQWSKHEMVRLFNDYKCFLCHSKLKVKERWSGDSLTSLMSTTLGILRILVLTLCVATVVCANPRGGRGVVSIARGRVRPPPSPLSSRKYSYYIPLRLRTQYEALTYLTEQRCRDSHP